MENASPEVLEDALILGCGNFAGIGSLPDLVGKGDAPNTASELLSLVRDYGISSFDTAKSYRGGASEAILGQCLKGQGLSYRSQVTVGTKVGNPHGSCLEICDSRNGLRCDRPAQKGAL